MAQQAFLSELVANFSDSVDWIPSRPLKSGDIRAFVCELTTELDVSAPFRWIDQQQNQQIFAFGELQTWTGQGNGRFVEASRVWQSWQRVNRLYRSKPELKLGLSEPYRGPLCLAQFSFYNQTRDIWQNWPAAKLTVPRLLVFREHECEVAVVFAHDHESAQDIIASLEVVLHESHLADPQVEGVEHNSLTGAESEESWADRIKQAKTAFKLKYLDKSVHARQIILEHEINSEATFAKAVSENHSSVHFYVRNGSDVFFGSTPETLLSVHDNCLKTHSLAGTLPRTSERYDEELAAELLAHSKNRHEQSIVTRAIRTSLERFARSVQFSDVGVKKTRNLIHLESKIEAELLTDPLVDFSLLDIVGELHPTPAVGGLPRGRAQDWLYHREPLARGLYAAPIGWLGAGHNGKFIVAIRSMLATQNQSHIFVGAGIVGDSDAQDEWNETARKAETMTDCIVLRQKTEPDLSPK